ncbi:unnamed protein product [Ambrosiozyma monospora]|uniref:Unnamed protein product n=1 Tax=Ambrosiozyma monospora TaxID=43982 RepID=A0ACB5T9G1_AMBMO|nr:unnamed protein product [Ambrosiozyma monospora]
MSEVNKLPRNYITSLSRLINIQIKISDAEELHISDYHDIAEDLKEWLSIENESSKKRLTLSLTVSNSFDEDKQVPFIDWASQFISFNNGISEFEIELDCHLVSDLELECDFSEFLTKGLLSSLTLRIDEIVNIDWMNKKWIDTGFADTELTGNGFNDVVVGNEVSEKTNRMSSSLSSGLEDLSLDEWLKNMISLKELIFDNCELSAKSLSHLPESLTRLEFKDVGIVYDPINRAVMLPKRLRELKICIHHKPLIPKFHDQTDELNELNDVQIIIVPCLDQLTPTFRLELERLLDNFYRVLRLDCRMGNTPLELNEQDSLKYFSLLSELPDNFDLSNLPPSLNSYFTFYGQPFVGHFPSCLESLHITMLGCKQSFGVFWKQLISPLKNLSSIKIGFLVDKQIIIDFRKLKLPLHMHTVEMRLFIDTEGSCELMFNQFPDSFIRFHVVFDQMSRNQKRIPIIVEENKKDSEQPIKSVLSVYPSHYFEWITTTLENTQESDGTFDNITSQSSDSDISMDSSDEEYVPDISNDEFQVDPSELEGLNQEQHELNTGSLIDPNTGMPL